MFRAKQKELSRVGIHAPDWNHVRLYAACADPDAVGVLRFRRGLDGPLVGRMLTREIDAVIGREIAETKAGHFVMAVAQLGTLLNQPAELSRLRDLLGRHFDDIRIVAHLEAQTEALTSHYAYAVMEGRTASLQAEIDLAKADNWWQAALAAQGVTEPHLGLLNDIQSPPFWLDYKGLLDFWEGAFGIGNVTLRPLDIPALMSKSGAAELATLLELPKPLGPMPPGRVPMPEPAANLTRMRQFNDVLIRYARVRDLMVTREHWSQMLGRPAHSRPADPARQPARHRRTLSRRQCRVEQAFSRPCRNSGAAGGPGLAGSRSRVRLSRHAIPGRLFLRHPQERHPAC